MLSAEPVGLLAAFFSVCVGLAAAARVARAARRAGRRALPWAGLALLASGGACFTILLPVPSILESGFAVVLGLLAPAVALVMAVVVGFAASRPHPRLRVAAAVLIGDDDAGVAHGGPYRTGQAAFVPGTVVFAENNLALELPNGTIERVAYRSLVTVTSEHDRVSLRWTSSDGGHGAAVLRLPSRDAAAELGFRIEMLRPRT